MSSVMQHDDHQSVWHQSKDALCRCALDIGGTLAKVVFAIYVENDPTPGDKDLDLTVVDERLSRWWPRLRQNNNKNSQLILRFHYFHTKDMEKLISVLKGMNVI